MAEGGFDPCECINILNHQVRMQRLISLLRDSQSYCTDNECINDLPSLRSGPESSFSSLILLFGVIVIAFLLYMLRPNSMRNLDKPKTRNNNNNNNDRDEEPVQ